jgi:hypothetical protein
METKIGCVSHDCDKCKAMAAELEADERNLEHLIDKVHQLRGELEAAKADAEQWKESFMKASESEGKLDDELEAARANGAKWQSLCEANIVLNKGLIKYRDALQAKLSAIQSHKPVASIYVATDGSREFDDWRCDLPIGRTELYAAPVAQPAYDEAALIAKGWTLQDCKICGESATAYVSPKQPAEALTDKEISMWWASENGLEDCDMCRIEDFLKVVRAVEAKHGIKAKETT